MRPIKLITLLLISLLLTIAMAGCDKQETDSASALTPSTTAQSSNTAENSGFGGSLLDGSGRELYPDLDFIEKDDLKSNILDYTLIDIRSNFEYRTAHMVDAISIPASDPAFTERLRNLVRKHRPQVVLYGNGGNDRSAHKAARVATKAKVENVFVYDGSMQDWATSYPEQSLLNGDEIDLDNPLLGEEEFAPKLLSDDEFREKVTSEKGILLDIRDESDSNRHPLQGIAVINPLDHSASLTALLEEVKANETPLFIFDDYGYKVRWFMYLLEQHELENYYFLKDGLLN